MKKQTKNVVVFQSKRARTFAIKSLKQQGFNYFVVYKKNGKLSLQFSKSKSNWVCSRLKGGIYISGN